MRTSPALEAVASQSGHRHQHPLRIVLGIAALLVLPAGLTLGTVADPGALQIESPDPTPLGYTRSLLLFIIPLAALSGWFARRHDLSLARNSFWRTIVVLVPLGFVLDILFGNAFFTFGNPGATLGIEIPAVGGGIPIEEFIFYPTGFMMALLTYIWADEHWMRAYSTPNHRAQAKRVGRIVRFHAPSALLGTGLLAAVVVYKKLFSPSPEGFPWYAWYLIGASFVPPAAFFRAVQGFINWRAFSFTFFLILVISLLWEVTLAIPYGWWGYNPSAMMGLNIGAWRGLPIEAVAVWMAVTFTTVIVYEGVKIWQATGTGLWAAFFGVRKPTRLGPA